MQVSDKQHIISGVRKYLNKKKISQAQFARMNDINASYLSNMLNGQFQYSSANGKVVHIPDRYFQLAAKGAGIFHRKECWSMVETPQFIQIISALEDAREHGLTKMIIGESGCGKTLTINQFLKASPGDVFRITVSSIHKINDIMEDLADVLGVQLATRRASRLREISTRIKEIALAGGKPLIIMDEAENLKPGTIGLCKAMYDAIKGICGFVLIGTDELIYKLDRMQRYNKEGIVQFRRRFKAGMVRLKPIDKLSFENFLKNITDNELKKLLKSLCSNYGELHDYLEPALKSAAKDNVELDINYFKAMYYLN